MLVPSTQKTKSVCYVGQLSSKTIHAAKSSLQMAKQLIVRVVDVGLDHDEQEEKAAAVGSVGR